MSMSVLNENKYKRALGSLGNYYNYTKAKIGLYKDPGLKLKLT